MKTSKHEVSISRDLKVDDSSKVKDPKFPDMALNSITTKFIKEPVNLQLIDKKLSQMSEASKTRKTEDKPKKKQKRTEEKAIFFDIFVKPKENTIKELNEKRKEKNLEEVTKEDTKARPYISNKINDKGKIVGLNTPSTKTNLSSIKTTTSLPGKTTHTNVEETKIPDELTGPQKPIDPTQQQKERQKNEDIMKINMLAFIKSEKPNDVKILNAFLHEKYIPSKYSCENTKKNYFNQLIQIRPPEGINAVVASPLMDSKGWAPSIPSINIDKLNTNLNDLMIRAKGGIKAGEITKEAHMAFYLGIMNEEEKKYESALKFYKKYFLSAKLLQDIYGTELALNRIAVLFSNIFDYNQSIYYNEKHKEITTHNLNGLVAYYNCGVCYRILQKFDDSIKSFEAALKMAEEENDLESYTLCLAQLAISYIFTGNVNGFIEHSDEFFNKNKSLNHTEMELEMQMLSGYIYSFCDINDTSKDFYENSIKKSEETSNELYQALALCNIGIIEAHKDLDDYLLSLNGDIPYNPMNEQPTNEQQQEEREEDDQDGNPDGEQEYEGAGEREEQEEDNEGELGEGGEGIEGGEEEQEEEGVQYNGDENNEDEDDQQQYEDDD